MDKSWVEAGGPSADMRTNILLVEPFQSAFLDTVGPIYIVYSMYLCSISMYKCSVCEALWAAVAEGALYKTFIIIISSSSTVVVVVVGAMLFGNLCH